MLSTQKIGDVCKLDGTSIRYIISGTCVACQKRRTAKRNRLKLLREATIVNEPAIELMYSGVKYSIPAPEKALVNRAWR